MTRLPHPRLVLEYFDNDLSDFGPGQRGGIIEDAIKVGWSWYSRFPASCYFTLRQNSPHSGRLVPGLTHLRIWYINANTGYTKLVWNGRMADPDSTGRDVVWRGYNYIAEMALSRTGYRVMYGGKKISVAVKREWKRDSGKKGKKKFKNYGATKQTFGLMQHVGTGVIENPERGGKPVKLDPQFGVIDTPRLQLLYDLSEIGRANTSLNVTYEISRSINPQFNFYSDGGDLIPGIVLAHPGIVRDFRFVPGVTSVRNDLASLGTKRGQSVEIKRTKSDGKFGYELFGRRQDVFAVSTLSGFRNLDDESGRFSAQKTILKRAVREGTRPDRSVSLDVPWQALEPFAGYDVEDTMRVRLKRDGTNVDRDFRMVGITGTMDDAGYRQQFVMVNESD